jgi:hypothetical protein
VSEDAQSANQPHPSERLSGPAAALLTWLVAAVINGALVAATLPQPQAARTRWLHHLFDLGHFVALGLLFMGASDAWRRWGTKGRLGELGAIALGSLGVGVLTLPGDLENFSERMSEHVPPTITLWGGVALVSLGLPAARLVGSAFARPYLRWVSAPIAMGLFALNAVVLSSDYPGGHLYVALSAAIFMASALAGARISRPFSWFKERLRAPRPLHYGVIAIVCLLASYTVVVWPSPVVVSSLMQASGSVLPPFLGRLHSAANGDAVDIPPESLQWYQNRNHLPPISSSAPRLLPSNGIVLVFSVDAFRADAFGSPDVAKKLPTFTRMRKESVDFANARAPSSQTAATLTSVFSGTYFSQQLWNRADFEKNGIWPHADPNVRFPELLAKAGVPTVTFSGAKWLFNRWGCVRGFTEETAIKPTKSYYAHAEPIMDAILLRLKEVQDGPLFLFVHFLDPHAPYDLSKVKGSPRDRWLGELSMVDAQVGRLLKWLDASPLADRTAVVVMSDHGEAFGEHNTTQHSKTLYDELIRVPFLIRAPGVKPRVVQEPVSLVDLGPTVLDLMGQPTPAQFMGQSLVPFLRGKTIKLTRPILAEGRLKQALVLPDGMKVVVDNQNNNVELYNLTADPGELHNLADSELLKQPLAMLRRFFEVHTRPGYKVPYR